MIWLLLKLTGVSEILSWYHDRVLSYWYWSVVESDYAPLFGKCPFPSLHFVVTKFMCNMIIHQVYVLRKTTIKVK